MAKSSKINTIYQSTDPKSSKIPKQGKNQLPPQKKPHPKMSYSSCRKIKEKILKVPTEKDALQRNKVKNYSRLRKTMQSEWSDIFNTLKKIFQNN